MKMMIRAGRREPLTHSGRPSGVRRTALSDPAPRPIKVAVVGINYSPEPTGIAPYTTGLAAGLTSRGHDVRVLTGYPHYPQWQRTGLGTPLRSDDEVHGVRVRRLDHVVPSGSSWAGRVAMELTFGLQVLTSQWGEPEVVVCVSPPLLATAMAVARARMTWRRPALGILVHDLYGRGAAEAGVSSRAVARILDRLESATFRSADGVAVIHTGFATSLVRELGVDPRRIREMRNWNHVGAPDPLASAAFRAAHHWAPDDIVVLHAGNMGHKQGLENVIAAAELAARTGSRARFVLLGDGNQRASLQSAAAGLENLEFLPPVSETDFPAALGAADVLLVNERPGVAQMALPSKLTSYFRSGKPILAATDARGLTASELAASGGGVCVPADRPDLLLNEAVRLARDRILAGRLATRGRRYCDALLSEDAALDRHEQWILDLADGRHSRHRSARASTVGSSQC
jgi:colanic acid biosynthesis glycosyl transferase WcaI